MRPTKKRNDWVGRQVSAAASRYPISTAVSHFGAANSEGYDCCGKTTIGRIQSVQNFRANSYHSRRIAAPYLAAKDLLEVLIEYFTELWMGLDSTPDSCQLDANCVR